MLRVARVVIGGLSGDGGKTLVAAGLAAALRRRGVAVAPFKKGPDYIDAAWLGAAAGRPGRNLDTFLMPPAALAAALSRAGAADLVVVEGNRGLHDGVDALGTHSTAALAKQLSAPVIIVADATKTTRTLAACVRGCMVVDPELRVAGVILNRVATARQEAVLRGAFAALDGPPVLGAIPRLAGDVLPSRHLGLVTAVERGDCPEILARAAACIAEHVNVDAVLAIGQGAPAVALPDAEHADSREAEVERLVSGGTDRPRIGVLRDEAFSFYYPENLEALTDAGADLVECSPIRDGALPPIDALYVGGGFPEVHAEALSGNEAFRRAVARAARAGLPVYAECGGLIYLARTLRVERNSYSMAGILDLDVEHTGRVQGHGYVEAVVDQANAFFAVGTRLRGHEFHYSRVSVAPGAATALRIERGTGLGCGRDAIVAQNVWASYLHLHALGTPGWASAVVNAARRWHQTGELG